MSLVARKSKPLCPEWKGIGAEVSGKQSGEGGDVGRFGGER